MTREALTGFAVLSLLSSLLLSLLPETRLKSTVHLVASLLLLLSWLTALQRCVHGFRSRKAALPPRLPCLKRLIFPLLMRWMPCRASHPRRRTPHEHDPLRELLRRDGWLYAAIALCVVLALSVSAISGSSPDEETRIARVLSEIAGAGSVSVTIYTEDSQPCGAVVVASGAEDIAVRLRLQEAVTTLLGLDSSRVAVYPRKGGNAP